MIRIIVVIRVTFVITVVISAFFTVLGYLNHGLSRLFCLHFAISQHLFLGWGSLFWTRTFPFECLLRVLNILIFRVSTSTTVMISICVMIILCLFTLLLICSQLIQLRFRAFSTIFLRLIPRHILLFTIIIYFCSCYLVVYSGWIYQIWQGIPIRNHAQIVNAVIKIEESLVRVPLSILPNIFSDELLNEYLLLLKVLLFDVGHVGFRVCLHLHCVHHGKHFAWINEAALSLTTRQPVKKFPTPHICHLRRQLSSFVEIFRGEILAICRSP